MTLEHAVIKKIIKKLLYGDDYRIEIITLLDAQFLQYAVDFFKEVVNAKLKNENVTVDWYKKELLNENLSSDEIMIHSGLNRKTISNMYNTACREIVIDASLKHYEELYNTINSLIENDEGIDLTLTIKFRSVSVDLNINESLIVINTLAVKRSAIRGGLWSTAGKQVEKPLMITLCKLFNVPSEHFNLKSVPESLREVDFYLIGDAPDKKYRCEVKLMGKGNPESADAVIARESDVLVADKLSDLNKEQLTKLGYEWVEMRSENGYKRFLTVLNNLGIPCQDFKENLDEKLEKIFKEIYYNTMGM